MKQQLQNEPVHCYECIYFERFVNGNKCLGFCHSQSPVIMQMSDRKVGIFPVVTDNCFCGDGEKKIYQLGSPEELAERIERLRKDPVHKTE